MSTRGAWGIKRGDKIIVQYNHFDCYPTGLGEKIENILKNNMQTITDWLEMADE